MLNVKVFNGWSYLIALCYAINKNIHIEYVKHIFYSRFDGELHVKNKYKHSSDRNDKC